jgi:hypothetical protein
LNQLVNPVWVVTSFWLGNDKPAAYYQPEYHGQVFTLAEIQAIVEAKGPPEEAWATNLPETLAPYIEAQVWNHKGLLEYVRQFNAGQERCAGEEAGYWRKAGR